MIRRVNIRALNEALADDFGAWHHLSICQVAHQAIMHEEDNLIAQLSLPLQFVINFRESNLDPSLK